MKLRAIIAMIPAVVCLVQNRGKAQSITHFGAFPTVDHSGSITPKLGYGLYYFGAFNLASTEKGDAEFFVFYGEQSLSYTVNKHLSLTGAYVYERQHPTGDNYRNENRFYAQGTYIHNLGAWGMKHRLRFDGRFVQDRVTEQAPFTHRLRYLIGVSKPLQNERVYFSAYEEAFFNTYHNTPVVYAENWAYAGLGYKTKRAGNFEAGPLYIFWVNNPQYDLTDFLYLQLTWATHLDFTHKKESSQ